MSHTLSTLVPKFVKNIKLIIMAGFLGLALLLAACDDSGEGSSSLELKTAHSPAPSVVSQIVPVTRPSPISAEVALKVVPTREWGLVRPEGAEIKIEPEFTATTIGKVIGLEVVPFQNKLSNELWWERVGGGWVALGKLVIYPGEAEAVRAAKAINSRPTPTPTKAGLAAGNAANSGAGNANNQRPVGTSSSPTPANGITRPPGEVGEGERSGAICNDGATSIMTGADACSRHGGVSEWTYR